MVLIPGISIVGVIYCSDRNVERNLGVVLEFVYVAGINRATRVNINRAVMAENQPRTSRLGRELGRRPTSQAEGVT